MLPFITFFQRKCVIPLLALVFTLITFQIDFLAQNSIDLTFNAVPSTDLNSDSWGRLAIQPDGKIIAVGSFHVVNAAPKSMIVRLNLDGSIDNSFNFCGCDLQSVNSAVVRPDGKIIVGGIGTNSASKIIRLHPNGSLDSTFSATITQTEINTGAGVLLNQPDDKILITLSFATSGLSVTTIYRLNSDGSRDNGFSPISLVGQRTYYTFLTGIKVSNDGKYFLSYIVTTPFQTPASSGHIYRYNADGILDTSFESPNILNTSSNGSTINDFDLLPDGSVLLLGSFSSINGINRTNFAKLSPAGNLDTSFVPVNSIGNPGSTGKIKILSDGKIMISDAGSRFYRLNPDGTLDNTFISPNSLSNIKSWTVDNSNRVIVFGIFNDNGNSVGRIRRLNLNGSLDSNYNSAFAEKGSVDDLAIQTNGKILISGLFDSLNGVRGNRLVRVNPDGTLDSTFNIGSGFNNSVTVLAVQPDNKILAAGYFSTFNGDPVQRLVRLNADGSYDTSFAIFADSPNFNSIVIQPDGKILVGGSFTNFNGFPRTHIVRLNSNGSLDSTFNPVFGSGSINTILVQTDGKIMVGGSFSGVNGFARSNLARLNADGSLDSAFNANSEVNVYSVLKVGRAIDGDYIVATNGRVVKKLNLNGTANTNFQTVNISNNSSSSTTPNIWSLLIQPDGKIMVGGTFDNVNNIARPNFIRLNTNGTLDTLFVPSGANETINSLAAQPDGKILVGGSFTFIDGVNRIGIARIQPVTANRITNFDFDGDGKADVAVYRPQNNNWYILQSSDLQLKIINFGTDGDIVAPADFDGDGKTDLGIFRPNQGGWWYKSSIDGLHKFGAFGANGDTPRPSDFNGDGRADYVLLRPQNYFWYRANIANAQQSNVQFGLPGDMPLIGDFNGDGKADLAIYRPQTGEWWWQSSADNIQRATRWGVSTDKPAPADYDADGKTDFAVFRPQTGVWYILNSSNGSFTVVPFGLPDDKPVPADYDGDGKADIAVFRPSTGLWYLLRSSAGFTALQFGVSTDTPIPNAFVP